VFVAIERSDESRAHSEAFAASESREAVMAFG
jgi:hypothetical protein